MIGGLTSSILLTLVLVPVVYLWWAPSPPPRPLSGGREDEKLEAYQLARESR